MLHVGEDGRLGAKVADLGTAVQLASASGTVTEAAGTTGYAGNYTYTYTYTYTYALTNVIIVLMRSQLDST